MHVGSPADGVLHDLPHLVVNVVHEILITQDDNVVVVDVNGERHRIVDLCFHLGVQPVDLLLALDAADTVVEMLGEDVVLENRHDSA